MRPGGWVGPASFRVSDAAILGVLVGFAIVVGLAIVVGFLAEDIARRTRNAARATKAARAIAEADRMRTALLATVSHDLRSPLASAQAAVSCLRAPGIQLTAADRDERYSARQCHDRCCHLSVDGRMRWSREKQDRER